jgi:hypothetical protein
MDEQSEQLKRIATVNFGMQLRNRKKYPRDVIVTDDPTELSRYHKPCLTGRDITSYHVQYSNRYAYFNRTAKRGGCWNEEVHFTKDKIVVRQIGAVPIAALDVEGFCCLNTMFMIVVRDPGYNPRFVLGLLNSKLLGIYWQEKYYDKRQTFPKIKGTYLKQLPIRTIDSNDPTDAARHDKMVTLVERILALHQELPSASAARKADLERQIAATDAEIDALVYELYDLTDEEIAIVEGR